MSRKSNYSTEKRTMMLDFLSENADKDVTVRDIEDFFEMQNEAINTTTIYRYLEKLVESGQVLKHMSEKGNTCTFQFIRPEDSCQIHLHLKCISCGKIQHAGCIHMEAVGNHLRDEYGFNIDYKATLIFGYCNMCKNATDK